MNVYHGNALSGSVIVNGEPLDPRFEIRSHSPTGFAWGYTGSGPAQLAMAIMVHEYGGEFLEHPVHYMQLKDHLIARLPMNQDFELTSEKIVDCVNMIKDKDATEQEV